jgi:HEAT repeat protein
MRLILALGMLAPILLLGSGCRGRPPYEGKSVAQLIRMLNDPKPAVQAQGAFGLSQLGPEAREAVPDLIEALKKDSLVRQNAALALGQIGPDAREAVPALIEVLGDSEWIIRRQAAIALGRIGPDARAALPALQRLLKDSERQVRDAAREAIAKVGPGKETH